MQTNTNKVNKTQASLQTTGGKDEPNIGNTLYCVRVERTVHPWTVALVKYHYEDINKGNNKITELRTI